MVLIPLILMVLMVLMVPSILLKPSMPLKPLISLTLRKWPMRLMPPFQRMALMSSRQCS